MNGAIGISMVICLLANNVGEVQNQAVKTPLCNVTSLNRYNDGVLNGISEESMAEWIEDSQQVQEAKLNDTEITVS